MLARGQHVKPGSAATHFPGLPEQWPLADVVMAVILPTPVLAQHWHGVVGMAGLDRVAVHTRLRRFRVGAGVSRHGPQYSLRGTVAYGL